jgi:hypothetical protein
MRYLRAFTLIGRLVCVRGPILMIEAYPVAYEGLEPVFFKEVEDFIPLGRRRFGGEPGIRGGIEPKAPGCREQVAAGIAKQPYLRIRSRAASSVDEQPLGSDRLGEQPHIPSHLAKDAEGFRLQRL